MKNKKLFVCIVLSLFAVHAGAADRISTYSVEKLLQTSKAKDALATDVELYFGTQGHEVIKETYGEVMTNKKTNAFMKTDKEACEWVCFLL